MSKKKSDSYTLGTIEKMLNLKETKNKKKPNKTDSKEQSQSPKKRGRKKNTENAKALENPPLEKTNTSETPPKKRARKKKELVLTKSIDETPPNAIEVPSNTRSPVKVYDLNKDIDENIDTSIKSDIILQLPLSEEDIEIYSLKDKEEKQKFLDNLLLEYNPNISPFNPKPIIEKCDGEDAVDYRKSDVRSLFRPCIDCTLTSENSVVPCEGCTKKFNLQNVMMSVDDALLKRAEDDALYSRPDPTDFVNDQIIETKLPSDMVIDKYDPNVIAEFSNEPSPFVHGKIKYFEEVQASPFDQSMKIETVHRPHLPEKPSQDMTMSTPLSSAPIEDIKSTKQFRILNEFSQLEKWPKRTNVYCWWDCHPFNNTPVAIPIRYNKRSDTFMVYGCFCSFECAMAYKKSDRKLCRVSNDLFYDLRKRYGQINTRLEKDQQSQIKDTAFKSIKNAMPRKSLSIFGGELSIQEFRKYSCMTTLNTKIYQFPLIPVNEIIEVVPTKYKNLELNRSNSPPLKLKRTKPLPGSRNTLEHTLMNHSRNSREPKTPNK